MGLVSSLPFAAFRAARMVQRLCCLLSLALLVGCAPDDGPELLEIISVDPPALEAGAELRVEGAGFPEHTVGRLVLSGNLALPGEEPRALSFTARVAPQSRSLIQHRLSQRELNEMLQGAAHGTFTGRVQVAFDAKVEGRPRLRGTSQPITLDLFARAAHTDPDRARAFLEYLGIELAPDWTVSEVAEASPAAQAGLESGDRLLALDGVHLDELADFVPRPREPASELLVLRSAQGGLLEQAIFVERKGFSLLETRLLTRIGAWALGACLVLLWIARPPGWLLWWSRQDRNPGRGPVTASRNWSQPNAPFRRRAGAGPLGWTSFSLLFLLSCGVLLVALQARDATADLALLGVLACGVGLVVVAAFLLGGQSKRHFSLLGATLGGASALIGLLPVLIAVLARLSELGTLRLDEVNQAQGALPWNWALLSSPWNALLASSTLLALVPMAGRRPPVEAASPPNDPATRFLRCLEWSGTLLLLGLAVAIYGGAESSAVTQSATFAGMLFGLKFALATQLLLILRRRSGGLRFGEVWSLWGRRNLVLACVGAGLLAGALALDPRGHQQSLWAVFTLFVGGAGLLGVLWSARRSWSVGGRGSDPWI